MPTNLTTNACYGVGTMSTYIGDQSCPLLQRQFKRIHCLLCMVNRTAFWTVYYYTRETSCDAILYIYTLNLMAYNWLTPCRVNTANLQYVAQQEDFVHSLVYGYIFLSLIVSLPHHTHTHTHTHTPDPTTFSSQCVLTVRVGWNVAVVDD